MLLILLFCYNFFNGFLLSESDTVITANLKLAGSNTKKPGITGASKSAPSASTAGAMTVAEDSGASATALGLGLASSGNFTHLGSQSVSVIDLFGFQGASQVRNQQAGYVLDLMLDASFLALCNYNPYV